MCPLANGTSNGEPTFTRQELEIDVARVSVGLLGATLRRTDTFGTVAIRITEVEAYGGIGEDAASHAHRGHTARNKWMFEEPGLLYVYFVYGMHWCANVVCGPSGTGSAVLIRAGDVIEGDELARQRRPTARSLADLARGPGNLSSALGITGADNGSDLLSHDSDIQLRRPSPPTSGDEIANGPRIGVSREADRLWRWWLTSSSSVSRARNRSTNTPR